MKHNDLNIKESEALHYLRSELIHAGHSPSVRELARELDYKSPRSALLILNGLIKKGWVLRRQDGKLQMRKDIAEQEDRAITVHIPLVGTVPCGMPLLGKQNIEAYVSVSTSLAKPGHNYFLLRAQGDSMNAAGIKDGDTLLVRQQHHAENGERVVALIDDEATVKEFYKENGVVTLKPRSKNKKHKPIIVSENFLIQGVVVTTVPNF